MSSVPPFVVIFAGALLVAVTRGAMRRTLLLLVPVIGALHLAQIDGTAGWRIDLLGYTLAPLRVDRLSLLFGYLFHLALFLGNLFALHIDREDRDGLQHTSAQIYAGSAIGAVFAGDLITLFVFWELLAFSSVFLIWSRGSERSYRTGMRYLVIQVLSGVLLLSGALVRAHATGSIALDHIGLEGAGGPIILLALGIKAVFPLLHNWLTDAYPEATPTGAVFLSAFTTKVAVYALARTFAGTEPLVYVGAVMTAFPIFFAVIENDLRRVLGYSMINQIGFMVTGIGVGTALAVNGAVAHAFNDVIFKGLLFMSMGAVLHMTGRINGSDLGGLYKTMPVTTLLCIVGAASISAFPLFSGFVSKSMVMTATLDAGYVGVWPALLFASAGVFHHAGIKIPYFAFFGHDSGIRAADPPKNMLAAMFIAAALCIGIGVFPQYLYALLPFDAPYDPYDATHVLTQTQLLFFGALAFVGLQLTGIYPAELRSTNLDAEWTYRWLAPRAIRAVARPLARIDQGMRRIATGFVKATLSGAAGTHGEIAPLSRTWPTGGVLLSVAVLLGVLLLLYL